MPRRDRLVALAVAVSVAATLLQPSAPPAQQATPVETARVERRPMADTLTVPGTLEAHRRVAVSPEVEGRVTALRFEEGQRVKAGDVLIILDSALAEAQLAQADADLAADRRRLERAETLEARGAGTRAEVDQAQAALNRTRAEVQYRQTLLQKTRITAPFDGHTGFRRVDPGAFVGPGDPLVELVAADPIDASFQLPGRHAGAVAVGDTVTVRPEAFNGETVEADVAAIGPAIDADSRSLGLRAEIPNGDGRLRPGMFVRVEVVLDHVEDALVVPEQAIMPGLASDAVFRVVDGKAMRIEVATGLRAPGVVQVTEGLSAGDTVVVAGQQKLRDGAPVRTAADDSGGQSAGDGEG